MADIDMPLAWRMQQDGYLMQINQLRAENDKLIEACEGWIATSNRLDAENAKLRELVAELWALADGYTPDDSELDTARDLMTELGIEVDE